MNDSVWESLAPRLQNSSSAEESFLITIKHFLENVDSDDGWVTQADISSLDAYAVAVIPRFKVSVEFIYSVIETVAKTYGIDSIGIGFMKSKPNEIWIKISNHPTYAAAIAA